MAYVRGLALLFEEFVHATNDTTVKKMVPVPGSPFLMSRQKQFLQKTGKAVAGNASAVKKDGPSGGMAGDGASMDPEQYQVASTFKSTGAYTHLQTPHVVRAHGAGR